MSIEFDCIDITNKKFNLVLDYIGEGIEGDFDEDDENDVPLLRYWISEKVDGEWQDVHNGSACCLLKATDKRSAIKKAAKAMLDIVSNANKEELNSVVQMISWTEIVDGKVKLPKLFS